MRFTSGYPRALGVSRARSHDGACSYASPLAPLPRATGTPQHATTIARSPSPCSLAARLIRWPQAPAGRQSPSARARRAGRRAVELPQVVDMAPRLPPAPGARQPRVPHVAEGGRAPRSRSGSRSRPASRTPAWSAMLRGGKPGPDDRAARRHGRAAGDRAGGPAVQVDGDGRVPRREGRRDARLRPRCAHRHPDGRGRGARPACARTCPARCCSSSSRPRKARRDGERGGASLMLRGGPVRPGEARGGLRPARASRR